MRNKEIELEEWQVVQMTYPDEYDYSTFSEYTLLKLAKGYIEEPNTATFALGELSNRKHSEVEVIALSILDDSRVDKHLIATALNDLADANFDKALHYLSVYGTNQDSYLVKEVVEILSFAEEEKMTGEALIIARKVVQLISDNYQSYSADSDFIELFFNPLVERTLKP